MYISDFFLQGFRFLWDEFGLESEYKEDYVFLFTLAFPQGKAKVFIPPHSFIHWLNLAKLD